MPKTSSKQSAGISTPRMALRRTLAAAAMLAATVAPLVAPAYGDAPAPAQPSAPAIANPGDTKPIHANSWTLEPARPAGATASPNYVLGVLCQGTFEGPSKSNGSVFTSTFIQCSEPAAISARTALDKCVRVGGPDDFNCTTVRRSAGSTTGNSFYLNVPVYYSPCVTGEYRPRAYYQYVNGIGYPDVVGNVVGVQC